tara:strand:- start:1082 stop:1282 length:201 start_codon:yes stop_codon:yes gene_type:complete
MNWKDEIKKYTNKPALEKLHRAITDFMATDDVNLESEYNNPFHDMLTRDLYKILTKIERELNKGDD